MEASDQPHGDHDAGGQEHPKFKKIVEVASVVNALDELGVAESSLQERSGQEPGFIRYFLASSIESTGSPLLFQYFAESSTLMPSFQFISDFFLPFSCQCTSKPSLLPSL